MVMKAVIVYDSFFGNTEKIAQAVGKALGRREDVQVVRVSNVQPGQLAGLDVLIVGSPTRAFRPSPLTSKWLNSIPANVLQGVKVAAFDTRIPWDGMPAVLRAMARMFGFAAKPISDKLQKKGGTLAAAPEGFLVKASEGPLAEGELERAAAWATQIAGK
jgi:flavodoxin